jgi:hypothetical protein
MTDKRDDVYASDAPGHVLPGKTFEEGDDGLAETDELSKEASLFINKEYNRLRLKFSLVIIPLMCFIYGLAFAYVPSCTRSTDPRDKLSLSYGVVFSLKEDTGLVGKEYANLTVWFCKPTWKGWTDSRPRIPLRSRTHAILDPAVRSRKVSSDRGRS